MPPEKDGVPGVCTQHEEMVREMATIRAQVGTSQRWMVGLLFLVLTALSGWMVSARSDAARDLARMQIQIDATKIEQQAQMQSIDARLYELVRTASSTDATLKQLLKDKNGGR
jgi:hypothetical protein